jgi:hypothetical protein
MDLSNWNYYPMLLSVLIEPANLIAVYDSILGQLYQPENYPLRQALWCQRCTNLLAQYSDDLNNSLIALVSIMTDSEFSQQLLTQIIELAKQLNTIRIQVELGLPKCFS